MENKKTKLTISGIAKKSIKNIELAKTKGKNSVEIEKRSNKFSNKSNFNRSSGLRSKPSSIKNDTFKPRISTPVKSSPITNDYERRKLAEQRTT